MEIKTFYAALSESRNRYRAGIIISPLPECALILRDRIYAALKNIGITSIDFTVTDSDYVPIWCESVGIQKIDVPSFLGIWILDKDPATCIQIVREVVNDFCS